MLYFAGFHDTTPSPKKLGAVRIAARLYWRPGGCLSLALLAGGWHSS